MLKFFKKTAVKTTLLILLLLALVLGFAFKDMVVKFYHHVIAYYNVYEGDKEYQKGKLQKAIDKYNKALELYPEHVRARYNLGNIYVKYEDYNSAVLCYEKALEYSPSFLNARINLGIILSEEILDFDKAIEEYKKAVQSKHIIINLPYIYNNRDYIVSSKAIALYNLGLAYKSKSLLYGDGNSLSRLNLKKAADSYKKSLDFVNNNYDTHYNLALTHHLLGHYTRAKEEYCKSIYLKPLNYEAHYNLALLLKETQNYTASIEELKKAGLILDSKGDGYIASYIYGVLNDVSQKVTKNISLAERMSDEPANYSHITYVNGKVVITEELDKAMVENMRNCSVCSFVND